MSYDIGEQSVFYDLPFGEHERHKLDIFLPQSLNSIEKKLPFFVLIHGGGLDARRQVQVPQLRKIP